MRAGEYTGPTLVVWGREDGVVPAAHVGALRQSYPHAEVRTIESAGHLVMPEQPDAFAAALIPFLDRAERSDPASRAATASSMAAGVAHQER